MEDWKRRGGEKSCSRVGRYEGGQKKKRRSIVRYFSKLPLSGRIKILYMQTRCCGIKHAGYELSLEDEPRKRSTSSPVDCG